MCSQRDWARHIKLNGEPIVIDNLIIYRNLDNLKMMMQFGSEACEFKVSF